MKRLATLAALSTLAFSAPSLAQAEFTEAEISSLARVAMPRAFQSMQHKCQIVLPANAYIYANGDALLSRLQTASSGAWPDAHDAIIEMASRENPEMAGILGSLPPEALQAFVNEMIASQIVTKLETTQCGRIDRVLELLDPLPPENLAELLGFIVVETQNEQAEASAMGIGQ